MASFNTLPIEILERIIKNIARRPFKTELLLLNKVLCTLLMTEQVKKLELTNYQFDYLITLIPTKELCSIPRYCNILDKIYELTLYINIELSQKSQNSATRFISRCTSLRRLVINSTLCTQRWNIDHIVRNLSSNTIEIQLRNMRLGKKDKGIRSLAEYVRQSTKLAKLHLSDNNICCQGAGILAKVLNQNIVLTDLSVERNRIDYDGAHALAESLKQNKALTSLNLSYNRIGDIGACKLAKVLKQNIALINLNLNGNGICDGGTCALAEGLKQNTTLKNLDLSYNLIQDRGAYALAESLKINTTLFSLNLLENKISTRGAGVFLTSKIKNLKILKLQ